MKAMKFKRAPRWRFWLARLLGKKTVSMDFGCSDATVIVTAYEHNGCIYVTRVKEIK